MVARSDFEDQTPEGTGAAATPPLSRNAERLYPSLSSTPPPTKPARGAAPGIAAAAGPTPPSEEKIQNALGSFHFLNDEKTSPPTAKPKITLNEFRLIAVLGRGHFGKVNVLFPAVIWLLATAFHFFSFLILNRKKNSNQIEKKID